jgi:DNA-directed RNA polymerase specialized sigma24 family protein
LQNVSSIHRKSGSRHPHGDYRGGMPARRSTKSAASADRAAGGNGDSAPASAGGDEGDRKASRRQERRLLHQDLSRTQLLDAAEEVFGRKGFHATTLKEIAELAEFSVGSVYSFFDN